MFTSGFVFSQSALNQIVLCSEKATILFFKFIQMIDYWINTKCIFTEFGISEHMSFGQKSIQSKIGGNFL